MEGIDIYIKFQTVNSWNQVKAADIGWCYQKVSDGLGTRNVQSPAAARQAGVLQGGYHFSQPGDPVRQANILVDRVELFGMVDLNPALDLEDNPPNSGLPNIPNSQKADWAIAFGRQVVARGHGFTLYANDSTWGIIRAKVTAALPNTFRWVARYRSAPPDSPWDAWQYTSAGSVPGVSAASVDRNKGSVPINLGEQDMTQEEHDALMYVKAVLGRYPDNAMGGDAQTWDIAENTRRLIRTDIGNRLTALSAKVDAITVGGVDLDLLATKVADLLYARLKD